MYFRWPVNVIGRLLEGRVSRRAYRDCPLIAVSPSTRAEMRRQLRLRGPVYIVPNGIDPPVPGRGSRAEAPAIAVVTRLVPHKQLHLLVQAVPALLRRWPDLQVDIAGEGPARAALLADVRRLGLEATVRLPGRVPEQVEERSAEPGLADRGSVAGRGLGADRAGGQRARHAGAGVRRPRAAGFGARQGDRLARTAGPGAGWPADHGSGRAQRSRAGSRPWPISARRWARRFSWDSTAERLARVAAVGADPQGSAATVPARGPSISRPSRRGRRASWTTTGTPAAEGPAGDRSDQHGVSRGSASCSTGCDEVGAASGAAPGPDRAGRAAAWPPPPRSWAAIGGTAWRDARGQAGRVGRRSRRAVDHHGHGGGRAAQLRVRPAAHPSARCGRLTRDSRPVRACILWASTVATVSVPWVLAQALVRARSSEERTSAIRFAKLASAGGGAVAAVVVGVHRHPVRDPGITLVARRQHLRHLPGHHDHRLAAGPGADADPLRPVRRGEPAEERRRAAPGRGCPGRGDSERYGAFGIGALVFLARWPRTPRGDRTAHGGPRSPTGICGAGPWASPAPRGWSPCSSRSTSCWSRCSPATGPWPRATRPVRPWPGCRFYIAGAVAMAFFPSLSRRANGGVIAARAVRMYAVVALPLAVVLATDSGTGLAGMFPDQYGAVATLLKYTAVTGLAAGGIGLITAFFQAADDYSCLRWLRRGLAGYVARAAGRVAAGRDPRAGRGRRARRRGCAGPAGPSPGTPPRGAACSRWSRWPSRWPWPGLLILLRPWPLLWLAAAAVVGLRAAARFLRPGARHARGPRWAAPVRRVAESPSEPPAAGHPPSPVAGLAPDGRKPAGPADRTDPPGAMRTTRHGLPDAPRTCRGCP